MRNLHAKWLVAPAAVVQIAALVGIALCALAGGAAAAERHAGTVLDVDAATRTITLDEFGAGAVRRMLVVQLAPDATLLLTERVEPVVDWNRAWRDTPIRLGDVRIGDFVVVDVGERSPVADRLVVTLRSGS